MPHVEPPKKTANDQLQVIGIIIQTRPESHSGQMQTKAQDPKTVGQMVKLTHSKVARPYIATAQGLRLRQEIGVCFTFLHFPPLFGRLGSFATGCRISLTGSGFFRTLLGAAGTRPMVLCEDTEPGVALTRWYYRVSLTCLTAGVGERNSTPFY